MKDISEQLPFLILEETSKSFSKFNATGSSFLIKFRPPAEHLEPTVYLKECITALTNYSVEYVCDSDLLGLRFRNTDNVQDNVVGIRFRR